jgi:hypothetical protein
MRAMLFTLNRLAFAAPLSAALLLGTVSAVPFTNARMPFQADLPSGWTQRGYPNNLPGMLVAAPGTPPPVVLQFFFPPYKSGGNDARALTDFIGGVEEGATGGGQAVLKKLSERPLTVAGIKGQLRDYTLTFKANGQTVLTQLWFGIAPKNLLHFQVVTGAKATAAQKAIFTRVLSTVKLK